MTKAERETTAPPPVLPDLLEPGLKLIFCGTAPSRRSAAEHAYYAHPGNRFWSALHQAGFTRRQLSPKDYRQLLSLGIGLTDLAKHHYGNDRDLPGDAFDRPGLLAKLEQFQPGIIAFTSKQAALAALQRPRVDYGLCGLPLGPSRVYVLPSPSGQARGHWDLQPWRDLAALLGAEIGA
ncbi:mismatch-specific DNA-glycosylase [Frateuria aurantia]